MPKKGKKGQKKKTLGELEGGSTHEPPPSPRRPRMKNAQPPSRARTPSPSPPLADDDEDSGGYEEPRGEDSGEEDEDGVEHPSEDDVPDFEGLPIPFDKNLNWEPSENYR